MLRIGFDVSPIFQLTNGVGLHTYYLLKHLLALREDLEIVGYVPKGAVFGPEQNLLKNFSQLTWVELKNISRWQSPRNPEIDLFHGTNFKLFYQGKSGSIVTIHDVFLDRHPEYSKKIFGQYVSFLRTKHTIKKSRRVITVSSHAAKEIHDLYDVPAEQIVVIPNGVSGEFGEKFSEEALAAVKRQLGIEAPRYILFLGGGSPRKNHHLLFEAFSRCSSLFGTYSLVCVGKPEDRLGSLRQTAQKYGIQSHFVVLEKISFEKLKALYSAAAMFVFPSHYEGFGMPVLEAMASGTPVIISNATALPEVAGNAALKVSPNDPSELVAAIMKIIEDDHLRSDLIEKGKRRAEMFSWHATASRTFEVYTQLCF